MKLIPWCVAAALLTAVLPAHGQAPPTRPGEQVTGPARVRGRVVRADTGGPLAGVDVMLNGVIGRQTTTDEQGRYEFGQLPAGRFTMRASKAGFVTVQLGGTMPSLLTTQLDEGRALVVAGAEVVNDVNFALPKGGVITGRVTDEFGEPVSGVQFRAERYVHVPAGRSLAAFSAPFPVSPFSQVTNDLGEYRIWGLPPGEYVVSARVQAQALTSGPAGARDGALSFQPTFFPGTAKETEAQAIRVAAGQEVNASFAMVPGRMVRISGTAMNSKGGPAVGLNVMLGVVTSTTSGQVNGGPVAADGSFSIGNVPAGDYALRVRQQGGGAPGTEIASMPISVGTEDLTDLRLTTRPGTDIKGQVEWEGAAPRPAAALRISPSSAEGRAVVLGGESPLTYLDTESGTVRADGTFMIGGIVGNILLRALGPTQPWSIKAVMANQTDIVDTGADAATLGGDVVVRVIMSDKSTELAGSVRDSRGQPVPDALVVLLPQQAMEGVSGQRYTRRLRPDQHGAFSARGLPPGRYVAAALPALDGGEEWNPEVQARLRAAGRSFTLAEGQSFTLSLDLMR